MRRYWGFFTPSTSIRYDNVRTAMPSFFAASVRFQPVVARDSWSILASSWCAFSRACSGSGAAGAKDSDTRGLNNSHTRSSVGRSVGPGVEGRVSLNDADSHEGIRVTLEGTTLSTLTVADGSYALEQVPGGRYMWVAEKAGYVPGSQSVQVAEGQTAAPSWTSAWR
ncbi:carboxypeptidase-like regulatory domain-containing protein [Archangium violaceum]|nr:carboxypeptidase-like regulatory domain-containing protein [Archangium violaceum]